MARLAIVIGVADYNSAPNLPACRQDGIAVADLLRRTGRFDEVLHISGGNETISSHVKSRLSSIADSYRGGSVEEIVFYFSGHGDFNGEDFSFVLTDYNPKKPNQTTLSNLELDGIFRSLNPELFVKVVDACHSGISYIKGDEDLTTYLKGSHGGFRDVYFMFSSQSDELSYASNRVSYFTHSMLSAVVGAADGSVRYRDLMSAASDDFAASGAGQTPKFVVQAKNTEVFCEVDEALRTALRTYLVGDVKAPAKPTKELSLLERIGANEKEYCTREEAMDILESIASTFLEKPLPSDLESLYVTTLDEKSGIAPQGNAIGHWLSDNPEKGLFAKPTRKSETYTERVPKTARKFSPRSQTS